MSPINQSPGLFNSIKEELNKELYLLKQLRILAKDFQKRAPEQRRAIISKIYYMKQRLRSSNKMIYDRIIKINLGQPLGEKRKIELKPTPLYTDIEEEQEEFAEEETAVKEISKDEKNLLIEESKLQKEILKRFKKESKKKKGLKERRVNPYVKLANKWFFNKSVELGKKKSFEKLKQDLVKSNMEILPSSYISTMILSTVIALGVSIFLYFIFLFINLNLTPPIIEIVKSDFLMRMIINLWMPIFIPLLVFVMFFYYPTAEKGAIGNAINNELPFVVIHLSAVAGSLIEPTKMFEVIIATGEYKNTRKEFIGLVNQINVYGYDLVTALRDAADKSPSKKLAELYRGLATTVVSGGDLQNFLDKRAQTLLFEYRLDREKYTKMTESFMDIYISIVIAAPMIFMLVLIMIRISNLGLSLTEEAITVLIISIVTGINILFLVFLQIKQPKD